MQCHDEHHPEIDRIDAGWRTMGISTGVRIRMVGVRSRRVPTTKTSTMIRKSAAMIGHYRFEQTGNLGLEYWRWNKPG